jgi:hypothetical protein
MRSAIALVPAFGHQIKIIIDEDGPHLWIRLDTSLTATGDLNGPSHHIIKRIELVWGYC